LGSKEEYDEKDLKMKKELGGFEGFRDFESFLEGILYYI
jgi:hypothetical protein